MISYFLPGGIGGNGFYGVGGRATGWDLSNTAYGVSFGEQWEFGIGIGVFWGIASFGKKKR
jgi:hypothetical protein